jgi:lysozyme
LEWDIAKLGQPDRWATRSTNQILSAISSFLVRVEQLTGRTPMIYTSRAWWLERHIPASAIGQFSHYPLWVADYSSRAWASEMPGVPNNIRSDLWQFTDKAKLSGLMSGLDANVFNGTEQDFLSKFWSTVQLNSN